MLALRVEFLTGRCVSTAFNDRASAEWPPHPARVFSAFVAAWAEAGGDAAERAALEWLEALPPPAIAASDADARRAVTVFVPVNDATALGDASREREKVARAAADLAAAEAAVLAAGDPRATKTAARAVAKARAVLEKARAALGARLVAELQPDARPSSTAIAEAAEVLPDKRLRQPRMFPSVTPHDAVIHYAWEDEPALAVAEALRALASRVTRLGHSSSFVSCTFAAEAPAATWVPHEDGERVLRATAAGQLSRLEHEFQLHRGVEPRTLPCTFVRYGDPARLAEAAAAPTSLFGDDWIVLRRVGGPRLPSVHTAAVAAAVRGALQRHAEQPPPSAISGHDAAGGVSAREHLAIVPLPFVGHEHADGALLGVALVLPRTFDDEERRAVLRAVAHWEAARRKEDEDAPEDVEAPVLRVKLGAAGVLELERVVWGEPPLATLRPSVWRGPAVEWLSATPIALDRNPGDLFAADPARAEAAHRDAAEIVARSCANVGLPLPRAVTILPSVTWPGTAKARRFPPFPERADRVQRVKVHAVVRFGEAVRGPLLLGAGRFHGLGLMRPVAQAR